MVPTIVNVPCEIRVFTGKRGVVLRFSSFFDFTITISLVDNMRHTRDIFLFTFLHIIHVYLI